MLSQRPLIPRLLYPKRPPSSIKKLPNIRLFTQNTQLLLISPSFTRPQLPFLHPPSATHPPQTLLRSSFQHQLSRLLTTETKLYFKNEMRKAVTYTAYGLALYILALACWWGVEVEAFGRKHPTPSEWALTTRVNFLVARVSEDPKETKNGLVDWAFIGNQYRHILARLENPSKEGAGVQPISQDGTDLSPEGFRRTGVDISSKSEVWRAGYHDVLMGLGRAAEHLDGWVRDTSRQVAFPAEVVIGPSNPRPLPVPFGAMSAPFEKNCIEAFESPGIYYMKILNTRGLSTRQRLDAALAYGVWLDMKGLSSSAEEAFDWALDIATGALPLGVNNIVDTKTGVINDNATGVSSNVLLATTNLAFHHARNNNLATALPIYLSILRATRKMPPATTQPPPAPKSSGLLPTIQSIINIPDYPLPSQTGDEPQTRTPSTICEEAAIMAHIGEILFASSKRISPPPKPLFSRSTQKPPTEQSGLSWTREAIELAESTLLKTPLHDPTARRKCGECLQAGISNWEKMVAKMLKEERLTSNPGNPTTSTSPRDSDHSSDRTNPPPKSSFSFFWQKQPPLTGPNTNTNTNTNANTNEELLPIGRWEREAALVAQRIDHVRRIMREEGVVPDEGERAGGTGGLWGMIFG